jgi:hypothetical protein
MRMIAPVLCLALVAGCAAPTEPAAPSDGEPEYINLEKFHKPLEKIGREYEQYQRVENFPRIAPPPGVGGCIGHGMIEDVPSRGRPEFSAASDPKGYIAMSESRDRSTHGGKLFWVFARKTKQQTYTDVPASVGQAVVKEAWIPELVKEDEFYGPYETVAADGKRYRAGKKSGLFIMFKMDPRTPDTDEGWVYGTLTPDGRTVTAGRVAACMKCHEGAPHERLFGLPGSK